MMHTSRYIAIFAAALLTSCSKAPAPGEPQAPPAAAALPPESENVLHAELSSGATHIEYAAQFEADQLTRIVEHRRRDGAVFEGEYEFKGARLLHYSGTKLADSTMLDLRFDMQGVLQSGAGPNVSEEDVRAVKNRAQLLRSHALAQKDTRGHR